MVVDGAGLRPAAGGLMVSDDRARVLPVAIIGYYIYMRYLADFHASPPPRHLLTTWVLFLLRARRSTRNPGQPLSHALSSAGSVPALALIAFEQVHASSFSRFPIFPSVRDSSPPSLPHEAPLRGPLTYFCCFAYPPPAVRACSRSRRAGGFSWFKFLRERAGCRRCGGTGA